VAKIKITTVQNLDLEFRLANMGERVVAWLLDVIIIFALTLLFWGVPALLGVPPDSIGLLSLAGALAGFYHLVIEMLTNGKSVGKMALGIRVVRLDGSRPTFGNYFMRWIFRLIETSPIIYGLPALVSIFLSRKGQRIGDTLAGTTVIREHRKTFLHDTIFRPPVAGYNAIYPQSARLSDKDVNTAQEVVNLYLRTGNVEVLNFCANRVCHVLNVHPAGLNALQFLQQIIRDHNAMY
jgi:uncharacterized RDD family membrane protein YckC